VVNILGLSADFHDSSASLVSEGKVVCAAAEERFTRIKHDASFPSYAAQFCVEQAGIGFDQIDQVIFYEEPWLKFTRVLTDVLSRFPRSLSNFNRAGRGWLTQKLWIHNKISRALDLHPDVVTFVSHHESHAAQAFYPSGFEESAVVTADAVGEWACGCIARASLSGGIKVLETYDYPNSIGLVYAAFTAFLGFKPNDGECSTMALAAFGVPRYADKVRKVIQQASDGTYEVDTSFFDFLSESSRLYRPSFTALFGEPRRPDAALPFSAVGRSACISADDQRYADIASSVQLVLEETMLGLAARARMLTGLDCLCLAGGVAMNAVAVNRLVRERLFTRLFVPPDPGDGGAASGAALLASGRASAPSVPSTPYLGKAYDGHRVLDILDLLTVETHHQLPGCRPWSGRLTHELFVDEAVLVDAVAEELAGGKLVGWVQGRFEQGPRALGNRSILADPCNAEAAGRLSRSVKQRAAFRPYALSVAIEDAPRLLPDIDVDEQSRIPRWMQSVHRVADAHKDTVQQALHVDLTTRPQVCSASDNPLFHRLLCAFGARRSLAVLLNTSFNESGYPIVSSPTDALLTFLHTDIDILVIGFAVIRKVR
jgi:carbamoyltransferase